MLKFEVTESSESWMVHGKSHLDQKLYYAVEREVSFPMRNNAFTQKQIMSQGAICQNKTSW